MHSAKSRIVQKITTSGSRLICLADYLGFGIRLSAFILHSLCRDQPLGKTPLVIFWDEGVAPCADCPAQYNWLSADRTGDTICLPHWLHIVALHWIQGFAVWTRLLHDWSC